MNTDISEIENEVIETPPEKEKPRRSGVGLAFLAFLLALAALAGTAWMWWQDRTAQDDSAQKVFNEIARMDSADLELSQKLQQIRDQISQIPSADNSSALAALERQLESGITDVSRLQQSVSEQLALSRSLQAASESMQNRLLAAEAAVAGVATQELNAGRELDLAEVDYLLRLASERLKLFSDPVAADQVLELADRHLAAMNNPMYLGVRQDIAAARRELAVLTLPDYFALSSELDAIQEAVASLPFQGETAAAPDVRSAEKKGWWEKTKGVFSSLVTVRRSTDDENERISLEDRDYVRQRLWLQLEIAHLSLMRRDQQAFRNSLNRVQQTISTWFDSSSADYRSVSGSIDELVAVKVQVSVPDISAPWVTLRMIREGRAGPPPAAAVDAPVEPGPAATDPPPAAVDVPAEPDPAATVPPAVVDAPETPGSAETDPAVETDLPAEDSVIEEDPVPADDPAPVEDQQ